MTFLKRSWISISRQPIKSIILFLLVFILGSIVSGALAVEGAILNTDANLRRNMRPVITFEIDQDVQQAIWAGEMQRPDSLTSEMMREIGELPYVSHYNYYFSSVVASFDLLDYEPEHFMGNPVNYPTAFSSFRLKGTSISQLWDVDEEVIEIVEGRTFMDSEIRDGIHVAVVSRGFAEINNLSIGSTFQVDSIIFDWSGGINFLEENILVKKDYEFEVIGFFGVIPQDLPNTATNQQRHQEWNRVTNVSNRIYVPNSVAKDVDFNRLLMIKEGDLFDNFYLHDFPIQEEIGAIFLLYDPLDLEAFRAAVEPILPEFWRIIDLTDTFASLSAAMITLQDIASMILWIAIGGTLAILTLLIMLFLRDRRHEIGIYLALGERKSRIVMQIMFEVVVTSMAGIVLAVFVGNIVSQNMSQSMIRAELASEGSNLPSAAMFFDPDDLMWSWGGLGVRELSTEEMIEAFDVSLDLETTLIFYGIGLLVVMLSTFIAIIYVIRMNPKKVLL